MSNGRMPDSESGGRGSIPWGAEFMFIEFKVKERCQICYKPPWDLTQAYCDDCKPTMAQRRGEESCPS